MRNAKIDVSDRSDRSDQSDKSDVMLRPITTKVDSSLLTQEGIGAVTRKGSAARQALARNCDLPGFRRGGVKQESGNVEGDRFDLSDQSDQSDRSYTTGSMKQPATAKVDSSLLTQEGIGAVTRKSSAARQALARNFHDRIA